MTVGGRITYRGLLFMLTSDILKHHLDEDVTISVDGEYFAATLDVIDEDDVLDKGHLYFRPLEEE